MEGLPRFVDEVAPTGIHKRRRDLPHWEAGDVATFLTFRLKDSIPAKVLHRVQQDLAVTDVADDPKRVYLEFGRRLRRIDAELDCSYGSCAFRDERVAAMMAGALHHFDGDRYDLWSWCIMPNHVHVVLSLRDIGFLATTVKSWKGYVAHHANRLLGRTGRMFQREYFDHLIRSEQHFESICGYVRRNPTAAHLAGWKWVWARGEPLFADVEPQMREDH